MGTNRDFSDLLSALSAAGADFLIVGGHAVMFYTAPRYTKDLDILVRPTEENARRVYHALAEFGAPLADLTVEDLSHPDTIFQIGVEPNRIDVLTQISAVDFETAWRRRSTASYDGVPVGVLAVEDLLANKRSVGRPQDLLDVELLEKARRFRT